jgi:hypothetical protein
VALRAFDGTLHLLVAILAPGAMGDLPVDFNFFRRIFLVTFGTVKRFGMLSMPESDISVLCLINHNIRVIGHDTVDTWTGKAKGQHRNSGKDSLSHHLASFLVVKRADN